MSQAEVAARVRGQLRLRDSKSRQGPVVVINSRLTRVTKFSRRPTRTMKPFCQLTLVLLFMVLLTQVFVIILVASSGRVIFADC